MLKVKPGGRAHRGNAKAGQMVAAARPATGGIADSSQSANGSAQDDVYDAMLEEMDSRIADITARTDRLIARLT